MSYGQELKERRQKCHLTQRELSEMSYVHRNTIIMIEKGKTPNPRLSTINLLDHALSEEEERIKTGKELVKRLVDSDK